MPDPKNPFSESDFDQIEHSIAQSMDVEEAINKARRAGVELPGMLEDIRKSRARLQKIKQTYFPGT